MLKFTPATPGKKFKYCIIIMIKKKIIPVDGNTNFSLTLFIQIIFSLNLKKKKEKKPLYFLLPTL